MIFQYNQLVPVIFGAGAISQLGEQVKALGCKKVMCVYDGGVKAAGIGSKAESSLKAAGVDFVVFDKISADPPSAIIDEASALARAEKVDGLVGVGGGSSMDSSKAIALMTDRPGSIRDYLQGPPLSLKSSLPIVLVPTTSGTGSECTQVCVITHEEQNAKLAVFVRSSLAIVDPELVKTLPPSGTASTGLDAFAHAAESVTCKNWNPRSELLALTAIAKIKKYLPVACKDGSDMEARTEMCLASNWAGIAFADTDVHVGHCVADSFSVGFHTPHGLNCAWGRR
jgi:alcohol dehydrogenase class IV